MCVCFFSLAACKQVDSLVGSCNLECCEGDLCNQVSPGETNTTAGNSTEPQVAGGSFFTLALNM